MRCTSPSWEPTMLLGASGITQARSGRALNVDWSRDGDVRVGRAD